MESFKLVVSGDDSAPMGGTDLIEFLWFFHKAYAGYAAAVENGQLYMMMNEDLESSGVRAIRSIEPDHFDALVFDSERERRYEFKIQSINKNSPFEMVLVGMPIALTAAVILSGGKVKVKGVEFELPPIGKGILALRKAFGLPPKDY
ncbi:hypothetical protein [Chromohalobacter moromii]|uniref:Uncharacterized protein n=1 Tax=Chromohalobacter moromii TaxID=2860329 RepID=A0A9X2X191_9GAMM|nr:hypothetical protein [Chromohalobacter moromii]MCT8504743.1 hypothetical protein [Chromohalobacter moromii]